jgi:hypothetical protein
MSNLQSLTVEQLRKAVVIKEQIERLEAQLSALAGTGMLAEGETFIRRGRMSAAGRARIAAAQRARWAKMRRQSVARVAADGKKRTVSAATKARLAAIAKARWASVKAAGKSKL